MSESAKERDDAVRSIATWTLAGGAMDAADSTFFLSSACVFGNVPYIYQSSSSFTPRGGGACSTQLQPPCPSSSSVAAMRGVARAAGGGTSARSRRPSRRGGPSALLGHATLLLVILLRAMPAVAPRELGTVPFANPFEAHSASALSAASAGGQCPTVIKVRVHAWGGELEPDGSQLQRFSFAFDLRPSTVRRSRRRSNRQTPPASTSHLPPLSALLLIRAAAPRRVLRRLVPAQGVHRRCHRGIARLTGRGHSGQGSSERHRATAGAPVGCVLPHCS